MMRHVRIKSETGEMAERDMTSMELEQWFHENTKDGVVTDEIILFNDVVLKAVDSESADFVLTDMSLDRDMEKVDPSGADFKNYKKNPVVLWAHDYMRPAIGKMESPKVKDGQVIGKVRFDSRENDPFAYMVGQKVKSGIINAGSIGFKPSVVEFVEDSKDPTRMVHRKWELMEFSLCNIPANYNALAQRAAEPEDLKVVIEALDKRLKEAEAIIANRAKTYVDTLFDETSKPSSATSENQGGMFGLTESKPSSQDNSDFFTTMGDNHDEDRRNQVTGRLEEIPRRD